MKIKIDQFIVTSDRYQYILHEISKPKDKEDLKHIGYYTDIESVFLKMLERGVKESTAKDLKELIDILRGQRLFIRKASNIIIETAKEISLRDSVGEPKDLEELIKDQKEVKCKTEEDSKGKKASAKK